MGIRDRLKKRIKAVIGRDAAPAPSAVAPAPAPAVPRTGSVVSDKPWYFDGDIDGWDHTNADGSDAEE